MYFESELDGFFVGIGGSLDDDSVKSAIRELSNAVLAVGEVETILYCV